MNQVYFKTDEDFEKIIKDNIKDKKVEDIKCITTGWTNIVYEVKTNDGNYFFRFPRDEFWSRTIVKDYEFAKYIHNKTDFNTANLELKFQDGRPFSMHKKIEGVSLSNKMKDLSCEEIKNISDDIAKFMYQLHTLKFEKEKVFDIKNIGLELTDFLNELLTLHVDKEDMKFWKFPKETENHTCLVHGDLNSSNVILNKDNRVEAIIDFGFGGYGNLYDDLGRIAGRCRPEFKENLVSSYEKYAKLEVDENKLNEKMNEWSNIDQSYINYMRKIGIYE